MKKQKTVLVVNDNENDIKLLKGFFSGICDNINVVFAVDGIDALNILVELDHVPDILITTYSMPLITGFELSEAIRFNTKYDAMHIFVINTGQELKIPIPYGINSCFVKPYDNASFAAIISHIILESEISAEIHSHKHEER